MKHESIERLIQKYLDREIGADEEQYLHRHLAECPSCMKLYQDLTRTVHALLMLPEDRPSYGFNARVMKSLGMRKTALWKKLAPVFAGSWVFSILGLLVSPLPGYLLKETVFAGPTVMRMIEKVRLVIATMSNVLAPFARTAINPFYIIVGLIVSIGIFYVLGKYLHKEVVCRA
jgi:anti-sigma factor RsiW